VENKRVQGRPRFSIQAKLTALGALLGALQALVCVAWLAKFGSGAISVTILSLLSMIVLASALHAFWRPRVDELNGLSLGLERLGDADFSAQLKLPRDLEFSDAIERYNRVTESLRADRQRVYQRELLLDTLVRTSPAALVLIDSSERVVLSNFSARRLLNHGSRMEGSSIEDCLRAQPPALEQAIRQGTEQILSVPRDGQEELHHFSMHYFVLNARKHRLLMLVELTQELGRQEIATWKRAIRVISHEINNALAPVKSLAHSGQTLLKANEATIARPLADPLALILRTIEERAQHVAAFISGYAEFARLPKPRFAPVDVHELLESLHLAQPFTRVGSLADAQVLADRAQLELVLSNLLKNAYESGSTPDAIELRLRARASELEIAVCDRGTGFSEHALTQALLPFFSTKPDGTGRGLALAREIIDAHGGRIALGNRQGGGAEVTIVLLTKREAAPGA